MLNAEVYACGVVQGVGFRPFVARLAGELGITGAVWNEGGDVRARLFGPADAIAAFFDRLPRELPPGAALRAFSCDTRTPANGETAPARFSIAESGGRADGPIMPAPDLATCPACLAELFTPGDPRHQNPFISCTHCGPRYSILHRVPYDRPNTSMAAFDLCPLCGRQYRDPVDRRFHAQTVCCNDCGPTLRYHGRDARHAGGAAALEAAVSALGAGGIVAVKGIGGYHLACDPYDEGAVARLRLLKGREYKPFAVMFPSLASLRAHCRTTGAENELLSSPAAPIVLVPAGGRRLAAGVCAGSDEVGAFLPYAPLQHLLLKRTGPLVMTSANPSGLPILADDDEMAAYFGRHAEIAGLLSHDRPIVRRLDDSVAAVALGGPVMRRRSRGYAPLSIPAPGAVLGGPTLLAVGAQEKNAPCLFRRGLFYPAAEVGDLDGVEMEAAFRQSVDDLCGLLGGPVQAVACDLHPDYPTTRYARSLGLPVFAVQHHHAHIASVMAEHRLTDPVIGVALDGTGYGADGAAWGGEFLVVAPGECRRVGHLRSIDMLGGDESVRQGWKSAACHLRAAGLPPDDERGRTAYAALDAGVNRICSSSAGRLFDAVSALLGVCDYSHYDGQCAIELERAAARWARDAAPLAFEVAELDGAWIVDFAPAIEELVALRGRQTTYELAMRFHRAVVAAAARVVGEIGRQTGLHDVALSGGVFQNRIVLAGAHAALSAAGFRVYFNRQVPPGDGGVALGQACAALWAANREGM